MSEITEADLDSVEEELEDKPKKAGGLLFMMDEKKFREEIAINPLDITAAMMTNSSMFAYYGHMAAKGEFQYDTLKTRRDKMEAILDAEYRDTFVKEGKKITETMIANVIKTDPRWEKLNDSMAKAKLIMNMQKVNKDAFDQRGEHLRSLGADLREERRGEIRTTSTEMRDSRNDELRNKALKIASGG